MFTTNTLRGAEVPRLDCMPFHRCAHAGLGRRQSREMRGGHHDCLVLPIRGSILHASTHPQSKPGRAPLINERSAGFEAEIIRLRDCWSANKLNSTIQVANREVGCRLTIKKIRLQAGLLACARAAADAANAPKVAARKGLTGTKPVQHPPPTARPLWLPSILKTGRGG
jgi:hypothetical protein